MSSSSCVCYFSRFQTVNVLRQRLQLLVHVAETPLQRLKVARRRRSLGGRLLRRPASSERPVQQAQAGDAEEHPDEASDFGEHFLGAEVV